MNDRRPKEGGEQWGAEMSPVALRRFFSESPVKTPSRYRSFLLSTLFTFGGDQ